MTDFRWYVAAALAGLEATAIYHLDRAGINAWAPTVADRAARLFPGYVFVELEGPDEAGVVNRQRGIHRMLPIHASSPLPLPRGFVEELRGKLDRREFTETAIEEVLCRFAPNQEVFIKTGPFRDHRGQFLRFNKGCGIVLTSLLGRDHELKIPIQELGPVRTISAGPEARRVENLAAA